MSIKNKDKYTYKQHIRTWNKSKHFHFTILASVYRVINLYKRDFQTAMVRPNNLF